MDSSINNGMCRCCAAENTFKDLHTTYQWMGDEEIYSTMLRDCFNVDLITSEEGNGGICEVCITQLRNAANFKKQVLHTEEQFRRHLQDKPFKTTIVNIVKQEYEKQDVSDDDSDRNMSDDFSPDFEIPIKQEPVEVEPKTKSKKRAASVKATATVTKAKKAKIEVGESSTRRTINRKIISIPRVGVAMNPSGQIEIKKITNSRGDKRKNLSNFFHIVVNSNATPITSKSDKGFHCCICFKEQATAKALKKHILEEHVEAKTNYSTQVEKILAAIGRQVVKLDITNLKCNLCEEKIANLEDIITHLKNVHAKEMFTKVKNTLLPFKFDTDEFRCAVCSARFDRFKVLQQHMNTHFGHCVCDVCGSGYVNQHLLNAHKQTHGERKLKCKSCDKVFVTEMHRKQHYNRCHLKNDKTHKCGFCNEKFSSDWLKTGHMAKEHGVKPTVLSCQSCEKTFINRRSLWYHTKKDHLMERKYKCTECDKQFFSKSHLTNHMITHTGDRNHKCQLCLKAYATRYALKQHLRIHADDRKFKCEICDQTFIQKCSWKLHMKTKHGKIVS